MKTAVCIGGAACVWDDLARARQLFAPDIVVACNTIGIEIEQVDHWVSYHPEKFSRWVKGRLAKNWKIPPLWSHSGIKTDSKCNWLPFEKGTSGLLAVRVARHVGAERVVACGIPMSMDAEFFDGPDGHKWREKHVNRYRSHWTEMAGELRQYVRSMSGWTAELLGKPDAAWLGAPV